MALQAGLVTPHSANQLVVSRRIVHRVTRQAGHLAHGVTFRVNMSQVLASADPARAIGPVDRLAQLLHAGVQRAVGKHGLESRRQVVSGPVPVTVGQVVLLIR